jgi:competence protein ComEA
MPLLSNWTRPQRRGLLFLMLLFVAGHLTLFLTNQSQQQRTTIHPLPGHLIAERDSLLTQLQTSDTIYPFDPNRLSPWLAYRLDLPKSIVDCIQSRVRNHKFFYTAQDFREYVGLDDEKFQKIQHLIRFKNRRSQSKFTVVKKEKKQLNTATVEELQTVFGIGPIVANRIVSARQSLQGFLVKDQVGDVWGIDRSTWINLWQSFALDSVPNHSIDVNTATISELAANHYISHGLASRIVAFRTYSEKKIIWDSIADKFELDSIHIARIALYLK